MRGRANPYHGNESVRDPLLRFPNPLTNENPDVSKPELKRGQKALTSQ